METSIQNAPLGNLKIINCRGVEQYYLDSAELEHPIQMENICENLILNWQVKLAQRNYDEKIAVRGRKAIKEYTKYY